MKNRGMNSILDAVIAPATGPSQVVEPGQCISVTSLEELMDCLVAMPSYLPCRGTPMRVEIFEGDDS